MFSGMTLDPRLAEIRKVSKKSKALVKESQLSSESHLSFTLDEPETPVLRYVIVILYIADFNSKSFRPLDTVGDYILNTTLSPLNLDDSDSDAGNSPAEIVNSSYNPRKTCIIDVFSNRNPIARVTRTSGTQPRRIRLIKDFIE